MEAPEKGNTAEAVANYFANGSGGRKASAHYCIDNNSVVQCVQTRDVAYGAPNANHNGIHLELAGYARQTREQWLDQYGKDMLDLAAKLCKQILMPKWGIPGVFLKSDQVKKLRANPNIKGFTTHAEVSKSYATPGGHWDPGPEFPIDYFMALLK